ncbi:HprK-related kinase A [Telluria beijingensis]|uniref:HprK-related kinase A n=1 Tax=Telluria beijingensis TaxID=3068633 RepID=UPI00279627E5|nr:HprK-related kinase A [Massilia sp. REN29]
MLTVSSLAPAQLRARLSGPGLDVQTGPFANRIHSNIPHLAAGLAVLYADYPLNEAGGFADFHLDLGQPGGIRRWWRPQVRFEQDGKFPFKPLPVAQAQPFCEWMMNWCVSNRAHGYLIVHAAVVEKHGRGIILPAPPGSGKSTLCAALVCRGWRLLSDELALVRHADGLLVPVPRPVSLKNRSIEVIRAFAPEAVFGSVVHGTMKGTVGLMRAPGDSIRRAGEAVVPHAIVFPQWEDGAPAELEPVTRARLFMRVADNAFNYTLLGARGFDTLAGLAQRSAGYTFRYSKLDEAMAVFDALAGEAP